MLKNIKFHNFGPLRHIDWPGLGRINLVLGENGSGKTFLLKALYVAMRTLEEHRRGEENRTAAEILVEKLRWTFQSDKIGDLVTKGAAGALTSTIELNDHMFEYSFGKDTTKQITSLENHVPPRSSNSIFLPAKEVLTLYNIILESREEKKHFGFDDTYLDLARSLRRSPKGGGNYAEFARSRVMLEQMLDGKIEFDENSGRWYFKKGNQKFSVGDMAEGIKKIAILDTLLGNRYLDTSSIVFIDEPESALHPAAISKLMDIVALLAKRGLQFFLASHSYFVVKKLYLIALEKQMSIPVISCEGNTWQCADLKNGMPENSIINESINLYKNEVELALT
ncbi:MAG: AAA family ATPase [Desulfotignum sp.]